MLDLLCSWLHCHYFTNRGLHNTTAGPDLLSKPLSHPQLCSLKHSSRTTAWLRHDARFCAFIQRGISRDEHLNRHGTPDLPTANSIHYSKPHQIIHILMVLLYVLDRQMGLPKRSWNQFISDDKYHMVTLLK